MTTCQHCNLLMLAGQHAHPCAADSDHPDDIMSPPTVTVKHPEFEISFHPESDVGRAHAVGSGMTTYQQCEDSPTFCEHGIDNGYCNACRLPTFCRHGFEPVDCIYCSEPAPFFKSPEERHRTP